MPSLPRFLLLFCFTFLINSSVSQTPVFPNAIVLPVTKDFSTLQYVTNIYMGTPRVPIKLVVDLGGPFLWVDCASKHVSSSHRSITSGSLQCSMARAKANGLLTCGHDNKKCSLYPENSITEITTSGELAEEIIAVDYVNGMKMGSIASVQHFLFSCAPTSLLNGLASGVKGTLGLGRNRIAFPSQLGNTFGFPRKFAICLSSFNGIIYFGNGPYVSSLDPDEIWSRELSHTHVQSKFPLATKRVGIDLDPSRVQNLDIDISKSLLYTPLMTIQGGSLEEYYINVKSIKINGKRLLLNTSLLSVDQQGVGGTKISTIVPYTTMESTIYNTFTKAYIKVATSMNMTRVAPVVPFGVCFGSIGFDKMSVQPTVPMIDLVLQSEMVKWRIYGRNSMVEVSDEVMCLGFLDGGLSPRTSIVIGGYQLEDNLLEFNLGTSVLGFSSSLLMGQTSCSNLKLYSMPSESL